MLAHEVGVLWPQIETEAKKEALRGSNRES
jgi:hypothetical protein